MDKTMTTTMALERVMSGGKPAIRLVVRGADAKMREICDGLGIMPVCDIANCRDRICTTPAELDACREPLRKYAVGEPVDGRIELRA